MLGIVPTLLAERLGIVLSALIVVGSAIGLTMHKDFYAHVPRRDFYFYYTNLSNLIVLVYFAVLAPQLYARPTLRRLIPHAEFAVTMCILLTHCVFHTMLRPILRCRAHRMPPSRELSMMRANSCVVHYVVPWLVLAYWLLCAPDKAALTARDALLWTLIPLGYLAALFLRAPIRGDITEVGSPYPYPFLDVRRRGALRVSCTCAQLYAACTAAGLIMIVLARALF